MPVSTNFFNLLFDFSFSKFIGIRVVGLLYGIGIFFIGLSSLSIIGGGFQAGPGQGILALFLSPLVFFLLIIILRILLEGFVAGLRIAENTSQLVENFKRFP